MAYLIYNDEDGRENIPIEDDSQIKIGRADGNDIIIDEDSSVSREHSLIYFNAAEANFYIRDLGSRNGTFINGDFLQGAETYLNDGDRINIGNAEFIFCNKIPSLDDNTTTSTKISKVILPDEEEESPDARKSAQDMIPTSILAKYPSDVFVDSAKATTEFAAGSDINGYEILRNIGKGRFSIVYVALQKSVQRTVTMKTFFMDSKNIIARNFFVEEMQKIGRLQHPNIISHFDGGLLGNICYLTMTHVPEGSLKTRIARNAPMDEKDAAGIMRKIADALRYALDEHSMIHLDMRPSNILFSDNDEPLVTDIGLSSWLARYYQLNRRAILGDPTYMSPDQAIDLSVDWTADMYSLGIIFYEMLVGRPPFTADSAYNLVQMHKTEEILFPKNILISDAAKNTVLRMVAKRTSEKFQSWDALIKALTTIVEGRPLSPMAHQDPMKKLKPHFNMVKSGSPLDTLKISNRPKPAGKAPPRISIKKR